MLLVSVVQLLPVSKGNRNMAVRYSPLLSPEVALAAIASEFFRVHYICWFAMKGATVDDDQCVVMIDDDV